MCRGLPTTELRTTPPSFSQTVFFISARSSLKYCSSARSVTSTDGAGDESFLPLLSCLRIGAMTLRVILWIRILGQSVLVGGAGDTTYVICASDVKITLECPVAVLGPWRMARLGNPAANVPVEK